MDVPKTLNLDFRVPLLTYRLPEGEFAGEALRYYLDHFSSDLIALEGGRIDADRGTLYFAEDVHIDRPIELIGKGKGSSIFELAPGCRLIIDYAGTSPNGGSGENSLLSRFSVRSKQLRRAEPDDGVGIANTRAKYTHYRKGDCVLAQGGANKERFWRAVKGGTTDPCVDVLTDLKIITEVGKPVADGDIIWSCEAFPKLRVNGASVDVGERDLIPGDNRGFWECIHAGTRSNSCPPDLLQPARDAVVPDGTAVWRYILPSGILVLARCRLEQLDFRAITGACIHIQAGHNEPHSNGASAGRIDDIDYLQVGLGVYVGGSDANAWTLRDVGGQDAGWGRTDLSTAETANPGRGPGYEEIGIGGGHNVWDHSLGGMLCEGSWCEGGTGRGIKNDSPVSTFIGCTSENRTKDWISGKWLGQSYGSAIPILTATESAFTVTINTSTAHGLLPSHPVLVTGVGVPGYNGVWITASVPSATSLTYLCSHTGLGAFGGGYVEDPRGVQLNPLAPSCVISAANVALHSPLTIVAYNSNAWANLGSVPAWTLVVNIEQKRPLMKDDEGKWRDLMGNIVTI
jgi:hypothetical protein